MSRRHERRKSDLGRRSFIQGAGAVASPFVAMMGREDGCSCDADAGADGGPEEYELWNDEGLFVQRTVDASGCDGGVIKARVDGARGEFPNRCLSDGFVEWSLSARLVEEYDNTPEAGALGVQTVPGQNERRRIR